MPLTRHGLAAMAILAAVWITGLSAVAAERQAVPGTRVSLEPPSGMTPSRSFAGFEDRRTGASIVVTEFPAEAYGQLSTAMTPENLATRAISDVRSETVQVDGNEGVYVSAVQTAGGERFAKQFLVLGSPQATVMVVFTAPEATATDAGLQALRAALLGLSLSTGEVDQLAGLPFVFEQRPGFGDPKVIGGYGVALSDPSLSPAQRGSAPVFIITAPPMDACAQSDSDRLLLAERLLGRINAVRKVEVETRNAASVDSMNGDELVALGVSSGNGAPTLVYQVTLFDDCQLYQMVGIGPDIRRDELLGEFRALVKSFRRRL